MLENFIALIGSFLPFFTEYLIPVFCLCFLTFVPVFIVSFLRG